MPGILKKTKGSKSGNKVRFDKDVKDWDGLSSKNQSWFNFIDLVYNLNISPNVGWNRVPEKHNKHVWEIIKYTVDRLEKLNRAYSMPMGSRNKITMFSIKSSNKTIQDLIYFVYDSHYDRQIELTLIKQRKKLIKFYNLEKFCKKQRIRKNDKENREWQNIKYMFNDYKNSENKKTEN